MDSGPPSGARHGVLGAAAFVGHAARRAVGDHVGAAGSLGRPPCRTLRRVADIGSWARTIARRRSPLLIGVGLLVIGAIAGYMAGSVRERQAARDSHAATAVALTGRVIVSNTGSRWIIFYPDGVVDPDNDADYQWYVIGDGWQDAAGGYHFGDEYPPCLVSDGSVQANPRRVELTTIDWDNGTRQPMHVALRVRCLD